MEVKEFIKKTNGRFFSATFVRSTTTKSGTAGDVVTRIFRTGVRKGVKGVGMSFDPEDKGLIVLWCHQGFRTIKADCIQSVKFAGHKTEFI